jgi:hypothetical protein
MLLNQPFDEFFMSVLRLAIVGDCVLERLLWIFSHFDSPVVDRVVFENSFLWLLKSGGISTSI